MRGLESQPEQRRRWLHTAHPREHHAELAAARAPWAATALCEMLSLLGAAKHTTQTCLVLSKSTTKENKIKKTTEVKGFWQSESHKWILASPDSVQTFRKDTGQRFWKMFNNSRCFQQVKLVQSCCGVAVDIWWAASVAGQFKYGRWRNEVFLGN